MEGRSAARNIDASLGFAHRMRVADPWGSAAFTHYSLSALHVGRYDPVSESRRSTYRLPTVPDSESHTRGRRERS